MEVTCDERTGVQITSGGKIATTIQATQRGFWRNPNHFKQITDY
jgi:hypothetical protein